MPALDWVKALVLLAVGLLLLAGARYAMYGCVADRFGRCIELWMIVDYPVGTLIAALAALGMGAWEGRGEAHD